jgi:hypothetical protein
LDCKIESRCGTHYLSARDPTIVPKSIEDPNPAMNSLPISPLS